MADSLVLRWFCRLYFERVPDATTLLRWAHTIRAATLQALNDRVMHLAWHGRVTQGRTLRIEGTVVQTAIHHPWRTDTMAAPSISQQQLVLQRSLRCYNSAAMNSKC